jgi:IS605 OrfB family transposase
MEEWRVKRQDWLREKAEWEAANPDFMTFWNGHHAEFKQAYEAARLESQAPGDRERTRKKGDGRGLGKRFERWHLWYEWLLQHPELVEWRGKAKATEFKAVPADVVASIKRKFPRQDKQIPRLLRWLEDNNPELKTLNGLRRSYVRRFPRFKRPPTLTLPSPTTHPYWFTFERDQFYKDVDFEAGTIQLLLIDEDNSGVWSLEWLPARIKCDPRLMPSRRRELFARNGRCPPFVEGRASSKKDNLNKPAKGADERKAGYAGAKLMVREGRKELLFTVVEQDAPPKAVRRKVKKRTCPADNVMSPSGEPVPLRVLAVDLGIRHAGAFAVARGEVVDGQWCFEFLAKGMVANRDMPDLYHIRQHDGALRRGRRRRGKPISKDKRSFVDLQDHRTKMSEDRFKKAAHIIVELARTHDVHVVLFEELRNLVFTAFDEKWMNRQLRDMNRRKIVEMVRQGCSEFGVLWGDINPWYTSHVCSRCFHPGWRFSVQRKQPRDEGVPRVHCRQFGSPIWDKGGHLFRCPHCGYSANADVNAASNLVAKFFGAWPKWKLSQKDWVYTWNEGGQQRTFRAKESFAEWAEGVAHRKRLGEAPF